MSSIFDADDEVPILYIHSPNDESSSYIQAISGMAVLVVIVVAICATLAVSRIVNRARDADNINNVRRLEVLDTAIASSSANLRAFEFPRDSSVILTDKQIIFYDPRAARRAIGKSALHPKFGYLSFGLPNNKPPAPPAPPRSINKKYEPKPSQQQGRRDTQGSSRHGTDKKIIPDFSVLRSQVVSAPTTANDITAPPPSCRQRQPAGSTTYFGLPHSPTPTGTSFINNSAYFGNKSNTSAVSLYATSISQSINFPSSGYYQQSSNNSSVTHNCNFPTYQLHQRY